MGRWNICEKSRSPAGVQNFTRKIRGCAGRLPPANFQQAFSLSDSDFLISATRKGVFHLEGFIAENKMQVEQFKNEPMKAEVRADENAVCEICRKFDAHQFGEQFLCVDCYQERGSCCAGEFREKEGE